MPIHTRLDQADRVLRTTVSGSVTIHDVREHVGAVRRAGETRYPELIDARAADGGALSRKDLLAFALHAKQALGEDTAARRAVVVDSADNFSMARVFAAFVAGWVRVGVFDDANTAEEWLRTSANV